MITQSAIRQMADTLLHLWTQNMHQWNSNEMQHPILFAVKPDPSCIIYSTEAVWNRSKPKRRGLVNLKQQYIRLVLGYQVDDSLHN